MRFKCFKDKLYKLILISIDSIFSFAILVCLIYGITFGTISFSLLLGIFNWYFFSIFYVLEEDELVIHFLCFKKIIKFAQIIEVKQTANTLSSFALARARIGIRTGEKTGKFNYTYISPADENKFLEILVSRSKSTKNEEEQ